MAAPVLDAAVLNTLRQLTVPGEPDVLTEVLHLFLSEVPARIERVRNAWAARNIEEVRRSAHSLKGSAGNIGAHSMYDVCKQLEVSGQSGDLESVGRLVDELGAEFDKVKSEIHRLIGA